MQLHSVCTIATRRGMDVVMLMLTACGRRGIAGACSLACSLACRRPAFVRYAAHTWPLPVGFAPMRAYMCVRFRVQGNPLCSPRCCARMHAWCMVGQAPARRVQHLEMNLSGGASRHNPSAHAHARAGLAPTMPGPAAQASRHE